MTKPGVYTTEDWLAQTSAAIQKLQSRPIASRALKATIDPLWFSGMPTFTIDGEGFVRTAGYPYNAGGSSWTPVPGQRVWVVPQNPDGYVIAGPIVESRPLMNAILLEFGPKFGNYGTAAQPWKGMSVSRTLDGIVVVEGLGIVKGTAAVIGDVIATLPVGMRPDVIMNFSVNAVPSGEQDITVDVYPDGTIKTNSGLPVSAFVSLSTIAFPAAGVAQWVDVGAAGSGAPVAFSPGWSSLVNPSRGNAGYWLDRFGMMWWRGMVTGAAASYADNDPVIIVDQALRPLEYQHQLASHNTLRMRILGIQQSSVAGATGIVWKVSPLAWAAQTSMSLANLHWATATAPMGLGTTITAFTGGWAQYPGAFAKVGYYDRNNEGLLLYRGLMNAGTLTSGAFVMPAGKRAVGFNGDKVSGTAGLLFLNPSNSGRGRLDIAINGNVVPNQGSNLWFSIDGMMMLAEQ